LGLVGAYDAEAIPVLIDLLADLPPRMRVQAENYLTDLAGEWAVRGPRGNDLMSRRLRRDVWAAWWKQTDGAKLLDEFKSRTPSDEDREKVLGLIQKLDDPSAEVRESAGEELAGFGTKAVSLLRRAVSQNHPRISPFAAKVLEGIEKDAPNPLPGAAPKLLALRKPEGTVEALLGYVPFAESDAVADKVIDVLAAAGVSGGKPDEALVKALRDRVPTRRAAAAVALCKGKATEQFDFVRRLLKDKDAEVRFHTGRALVAAGEKAAVPTLIALLKELPLEQVWEVEDFLSLVAGDKTPLEVVTADAASRAKAADAWTAWWKANAGGVDLAKLDLSKRDLGFLVIVENWNPTKGSGRVLELDNNGKLRWEVRPLNYPYDAEVLRGGNVLVVEQQNQVTERDRAGKVLWNKYYGNVFHAERLRNGHTFLACRNQLMVVNKEGVSVFSHSYTANSILAAKRFRDGSMAYVSYSGHYVRLDRDGKQVKTIQFPWFNFSVAGAEVLAGDRVVVSVNNFNKVVEFDSAGKQVWEASVTYPLIPFRLSNGHTILASHSQTQITEIDRNGKVVKETKTPDYRPYRVYRR
jgi:outer membrane protein assembly factor BamB